MIRTGISRFLAWALTGAMVFTGMPSATVRAEEAVPLKLADFDFNAGAENGVFTGGTAKAAVIGSAVTKVKLGDDAALYLDGASSYLNITAADDTGLLAGKEEITVSYDAKPESSAAGWTFFAAPNADAQVYPKEHYMAVLHSTSEITAQRYHNTDGRPGNDISKTNNPGGWIHVDLVISETTTKLYVNGVSAGEHNSTYKLSDILGATGGILQVGKGNWGTGEFFKGWIDNYRIYDEALSETAIQEQYREFEEFMEKLEAYENRSPLEKDYDALELLNQEDVRGNLPLVKKGPNGSDIQWTSSRPEVVETSAEESVPAADSSLYDGGIVHRPAAGEDPVEVHLTATLTYDGESKNKEFTVIVQPMPENLDTDYTAGYLWAHFGTQAGYEKIFFGYSEDGLAWNKLNKVDGSAQAVLENSAPESDMGVRDPHLIRSAEGDRYWILGTDLHAEGGGAGGSGWDQLGASQNIVVWESADLVNWSEPRLVYAGFQDAGCIWAPEAIYDDTTGDYVVYWSARDKSKAGTNDNALRVYVCRTRDFNTFSEPKVWLSEDPDSETEENIIDSTIVKSDGKFYRFSTSDWYTVVDVSDTLDTEDVLDVRNGEMQSTPKGSWKRLVTRSNSSTAGFDRREGFTVYQLPDGSWCMMGDDSGYKAFVTDDLSTLGTEKVTAANASFDERFRHGTVVRLSEAEEARVLEAYQERETAAEDPIEEPVLKYDFESDLGTQTMTDSGAGDATAYNGTLFGNASIVYDEDLQSNVLKLDGTTGGYAEIPTGFFDNRNVMTISMDVKAEENDRDIFTFTYGKNDKIYNFLRVKGSAVRNAVTLNGWENNSEQEVAGTGVAAGNWQKVVIVINRNSMKLYLDGSLVSENNNTGITTSDLGTNLISYLGKSFYSADGYFKGSFDNFTVYNRELSKAEIVAEVFGKIPMLKSVTIGTVPENPSQTMGTDDHTAVTSHIDQEKKEITSYLRNGTDLSAVPVTLNLLMDEVSVTVGQEAFTGTMDLRSDAELSIAYSGVTETYTIKTPKYARNPVLPGQYADPDIDYFDGKYWIYPTTDGYEGWSGTVFHAWSSENLEDWTDEGIILDLAAADSYQNEQGVDVAVVPWSTGNAWAPTIEKKDDKYYFYFCGHDTGTNAKAIGVAWADNPAGPFTVKETPLITISDCKNSENISMGQAIDPSVFTAEDGTSYLFFGNGNAAVVELDEDMMNYVPGTMANISGLTDFRESVVVTERDGLYHFTWSCDDANSPNYHVNYGTATDLYGPVTYHYTLLQKDEDGDMLGTAHQSICHDAENDRYYIAYHRFYTPLGIYTSGLGVHRTTCIDEITFDPETGYMNPLKPTMEGVTLKDPSEEAEKKLQEIIAKADFGAVFPTEPIAAAGKLELPGEWEGASVTWTSDNVNVIANDGTIKLPAADTVVTLTAVFSYENIASGTRDYKVTVKGNQVTNPPTAQETLNKIVAAVDFSTVFGNGTITSANRLNLPATYNGASVTWTSDNTSIIANDGTVKLPIADTSVTLTAVFTYGTATASKKIQLSVKGTGLQEEETPSIAESVTTSNTGLPTGSSEESKNSSYAALSVKVSSVKNTSVKLQWSKVNKADGYVVFGNKANSGSKKYKFQLLKVIEKNTTKTYTNTKLTKGTYYKYIVQAYQLKNGKPQIIATSKTVYAATSGGKYGNVSSLKLNKTKVSLNVGKKFTLKATVKKNGTLKTFRKVSFESSNTKIATVSSKGVIKAKKKGSCYIYVYAQNGISKKVKVTVKKK